jgi:hypothetical protein
MSSEERKALMARYGGGVALLKQALAEVPVKAMRWKPAPDKWSVHEVVVHCADSETNAAMRIRYLVGEDNPAIQGYDQDRWVQACDYASQSFDLALAQVVAVRAWTHAFIARLPAAAWGRAGTHTEMPGESYTALQWLAIYAEHLEIHARQIRRNVAAWRAAGK